MDLIRDLLYMQTDIMDDIVDNFPMNEGAIGLGLVSFDESGKPESPTVIIRNISNDESRNQDCKLFRRIAQIAYSIKRNNLKFDSEEYPAAVFDLQDADGKTYGAAILAIIQSDFRPKDINMTAEEYMNEFREYFSQISPKVGHVYGNMFF